MRSIRDIDVKNKKVLVRVNFDVPLDDNGDIADDERIRASLSTIVYLLANQAKIILISHLGKPNGQMVQYLRLDKIALRLQELLNERMDGKKVIKLNGMLGSGVRQSVETMGYTQVLLLENLRFHPGEEARDRKFAEELASCADYFVEDAFPVCHRNHASVVLIPKFLPSYSGFELEKELAALSPFARNKIEHPYAIILGGAKIDKIDLIQDLADRADHLLIGGLLANKMIKENKDGTDKIVLPVDGILEDGNIMTVDRMSASDIEQIRDIGAGTIKTFCDIIQKSKTVLWDGPLGKVENERFVNGTKEIIHCVNASRAYSVIGGGDTLAIAKKYGTDKYFDFVSIGGGAMLEYVAGRQLPGITALN